MSCSGLSTVEEEEDQGARKEEEGGKELAEV